MFLKSLGAAIAALALATACGEQARATLTPLEGDSFLGPADAKVTVTEYGAPTCPACADWHSQNWSRLKAGYIDSNKIKFVFREFPSHNPPVDAAIFSIARCAGQADWFKVIDKAFEKQVDIERASQRGEARPALVSLGKEFRLSQAQVESCIKDPKNIQRIHDVQEEGYARGVSATPTFFINDREVHDASYEAMSAEIDALLGAVPLPAETPAPAPAEAPPAEAPAAPPAQQPAQ
jgi:protein-disulfide isomerase